MRILDSSCAAPWWYMVRRNALPRILSCGGWAPPTYFEATGDVINLYEVPLDVLMDVSEESAEEGGSAPLQSGVSCIRVSVDGSSDERRGIAAGCVASGVSMSTRASLALPGITGAGASELLGVTLGILGCFQSRRMHSRFVLVLDRMPWIMYSFSRIPRTETDGIYGLRFC